MHTALEQAEALVSHKVAFGDSVPFSNKNKMMKFILSLSLNVLLFIGCSGDCNESLPGYRPRQCSIIVEEQNLSGRTITLKGRNSKTGKEDKYRHEGGWYVNVYKFIQVGDTVIKQQGELVFNVHKQDTILAIPFECQGKIYK